MLERVRIGIDCGMTFKVICLEVDEYPGNPFFHRCTKSGNDWLARFNRHIAGGTGKKFRLFIVIPRLSRWCPRCDCRNGGFPLQDNRNRRQLQNGLLDSFGKGRWQRHSQAIKAVMQQKPANSDGEITALVYDREERGLVTQSKDRRDFFGSG